MDPLPCLLGIFLPTYEVVLFYEAGPRMTTQLKPDSSSAQIMTRLMNWIPLRFKKVLHR